ncbi:MAG: ATP-binding cassette domain-containing protein [Alphaproteobacteria bacterium]|nr:ATP-binding cassette domain-containing protein [Alphaproteobacteria bacterium]
MRAGTSETLLRVEHVSMRFGGLTAVGDLSFDAKRGEITALIGPNGAGKTTVFNCITGFYKPTEGAITLIHEDGTEFALERMDDFRITERAKVARTFQNIRLFAGMTVLENLMVAQHNTLMRASGYTFAGIFNTAGYQRANREAIEFSRHWLDKTGLTARADDPAGDLPYGDQRRLEIARAMCTKPHLLCLDEPAAGLNPRESEDLNRLLLNIRSEEKVAILLIEHDMSVVMGISDHIVVLDYGVKISDGTPEKVRNDPAVIRAYLGVEDDEEDPEVEAVMAEAEALAATEHPAAAVTMRTEEPEVMPPAEVRQTGSKGSATNAKPENAATVRPKRAVKNAPATAVKPSPPEPESPKPKKAARRTAAATTKTASKATAKKSAAKKPVASTSAPRKGGRK